MLSSKDFIRESLELHLFFARIMKEHTLFLELSFTPRDNSYKQHAGMIRHEFDRLLTEVVSLSYGIVRPSVLQSGEVITPYTLNAELSTSYYTGVNITTEITENEYNLMGKNDYALNPMLEQKVYALNQNGIELIKILAQFKSDILSKVVSCKMFTTNYPLLLDHVLREAEYYLEEVIRIQNRQEVNLMKEAATEKVILWNDIMEEHAQFIRGLLDPTEEELINTANEFVDLFEQLIETAELTLIDNIPLNKVVEDSLNTTTRLRDFKSQGTKGLLTCTIKSLILPLLADHTLREANHYIRQLKLYQ